MRDLAELFALSMFIATLLTWADIAAWLLR